jgi:hypothetical protein
MPGGEPSTASVIENVPPGVGHELRLVRRRQTEQLADDGKRQPARISFDKISRASLGKELAGQFAGDGKNTRLHIEDRAPSKGSAHHARNRV